MGIRTKSFFLALFSGIVAFGVNAGMDHFNDRDPDYMLYVINFFLWFIIIGFTTYRQFKKENK